jgi:hypothetical protein
MVERKGTKRQTLVERKGTKRQTMVEKWGQKDKQWSKERGQKDKQWSTYYYKTTCSFIRCNDVCKKLVEDMWYSPGTIDFFYQQT